MARPGTPPAKGKKGAKKAAAKRAAKKVKSKKEPAPPKPTREDEVAKFQEDMKRAGAAEDAEPWPTGQPPADATDVPSLGDDEREGRAAFNQVLIDAADEGNNGPLRSLLLVDGAATPQVRDLEVDTLWYSLKDLLGRFERSEAVPDVVDTDGKVRVRRGAFHKGKRIPATDLRSWLDQTQKGGGVPEQATLEGDLPEPPEGGRVESWVSSGLVFTYPHYEAKFTHDQLDAIRGADDEKQDSLVDRKMKLHAATVPPGEVRDEERRKIIADIVGRRNPEGQAENKPEAEATEE